MIRQQVKDIQLSIRKISEKARQQDECVRFDIGQPSFDTPQHVKDAVKEGIEEKQGYAPTRGFEELRELAAREESLKNGVEAEKENILVTTGGMEALFAVFTSVLDKDGKAVFNDPCWGPYKLISGINGNRFSQVNYFDGDRLTEEVKQEFEDAEMAVVNSPSNPSGRVLNRAQAEKIGKLADSTDTLLISDEVYHRLTYGKQFVSPTRFTDNYVIIGSTSKSHAMTGWRIGWVNADEETVNHLTKASRAMTACPPRASQYAAIEALKNDSHVKEMRETYHERRDALVDRMDALGWDFVAPEGAIYAFPDVGRDSWDFCMDMIEKGVAMVPGEPMGPESDTNVRICFGSTSKNEINKAFDILEDELQ